MNVQTEYPSRVTRVDGSQGHPVVPALFVFRYVAHRVDEQLGRRLELLAVMDRSRWYRYDSCARRKWNYSYPL
jgi:hypothetical protein